MMLFVLVISFSCILRAGALPGCSSPCLNGGTCLRSLGECVCVEGWTGAYCQSRETVCPHGYYGVNCLKPCGRCIGNTVCNWVTGNCTSGCEEGSYGWRCEESCGECRGGPACEQATGLCDQGCELTYYGTTCKLRCNCSDARPCDQTTGACSACDEGFYGAVCKRRCGNCRSLAKCNPRSGICETGCHDGYSPPYCKRRISVTPRSPQITTSLPWWKTPQIMIPLGAVYGLLSGIFLCCCLPRMCKRRPTCPQCACCCFPSPLRAPPRRPFFQLPTAFSAASFPGVRRSLALVKRLRDIVGTRASSSNTTAPPGESGGCAAEGMIMHEGRLNGTCGNCLPLRPMMETQLGQVCQGRSHCSCQVNPATESNQSSSWSFDFLQAYEEGSRPRPQTPVPSVLQTEQVSTSGRCCVPHVNPAFDSSTDGSVCTACEGRSLSDLDKTDDPPPPYELVASLSSLSQEYQRRDPLLC